MEKFFEEKETSETAADRLEAEWEAVDESGTYKPAKFQLERLRDIEVDKGRQWLISGLMPANGLHVLYGAPGTGKSFLALHAALHIAAGRPWAGHKVYPGEGGGVVYIASEGGRNFRKRVVAAKSTLKLPPETPFALITQAPNLGDRYPDTEVLIHDIKQQCGKAGFKPRLIVLDTLSRSITDLNESDTRDIMKFVEHAQEIADEFDALVMPIHHCGKDESRGMRGSSALHGAADAEWLVTRDQKKIRRVIVEKMKDGPEAAKLRYDLKDENLGKDAHGEDIVTCVAEVYVDTAIASDPSDKAAAEDTTWAAKVMHGLQMLSLLEGKVPAGPSPASAGAKVVPIARLKEAIAAAGLLPADAEAARKPFSRSLDKLVEAQIAGKDGTYIWLIKPEAAKATTSEAKPDDPKGNTTAEASEAAPTAQAPSDA